MPAVTRQEIQMKAEEDTTAAQSIPEEQFSNDSAFTLIDSLNMSKEIILNEQDFSYEAVKNDYEDSVKKDNGSESNISADKSMPKWARGFQVQILATEDGVEAEEKKAEVSKKLNEPLIIIYEPPYFRLRAGNFVDHDEAVALKEKLLEMGYDGVWVVKAKVISDKE
ncbi:MAG: hypothetical protein ABIA63_15080 [bacterium]